MHDDKLRSEFNIPASHTIVERESRWEQRKGQDTDTYLYEELDEHQNVVGKYIVRDATSIYPPFERTVAAEKIG